MHKRPSLKQSLETLSKYKNISEECNQTLIDYNNMKKDNEFLAARMVVEVVNHINRSNIISKHA